MPPKPKRPRSKRNPPIPSVPTRHLVEAFYHRKGLAGDPKAAVRMNMLFEPLGAAASRKIDKDPDFGTDIFQHVCYSLSTKRTRLAAKKGPWPGSYGLSRVISSSLGMYRTLCLFPKAVVTMDPRSTEHPFNIYLRHITTGHTIAIGDWRGGFRFLTAQKNPKKVPKTFMRDILRLMDTLLSDRCPHPQKGLVAGLVG